MMSAVEQPQPQRESEGWGLLVGLVLFSALAHSAAIVLMPTYPPVAEKRTVEMEFFEPPKPPPPPPEEEKKPEPPKPDPPKAKPPPVKMAEPAPPPKDAAPPPPNQTPPPEASTKPPVLVVGLTLDSTTESGGMALQVGNTTYGKASDKVVDPKDVKAYSAPKYAPPGGADTEPVPMGEVKVDYPPEAKKAEVEGNVILKVTLDPEGNVTQVVVVNGPGYGLNEAARDALKRFRFKPATKGGEPVGYTIMYTYRFLLD
jgi:protein TonB